MCTYNQDESGMGVDEKAWNTLYYEIGRAGLDFVDNMRVARSNNPLEMFGYRQKAAQGCCGVFESHVTIDGIEFTIGCNYGH